MLKINYLILGMLAFSALGCLMSKKQQPMGIKPAYNEPHRPQFHFTPPTSWMNDPNGMVYYEGEYHLFYQYYPDATVWGPMHWGHAVSKDMVEWVHLPIALYPDSMGYIFSGSAVVDWNNTSGFGQNGKPPLVAIFTHHNMDREKANRKDVEAQSIAYSNDRGRTWTKYAGNPVINNPAKARDFRDPKVVWDADSKQWVMVLAVGDHAEFWGSPNLKDWTFLSDFGHNYGAHGGVWECPDLFQIQTESGGPAQWVLLVNINPGHPNGGSGTQYFFGQFDGKAFNIDPQFAKDVPKGNAQWLDWGKDHYAAVSWSDVPAPDGRRLFLAWMSNWEYAQNVPTGVWRSACTLPRKLTLRRTPTGDRLYVEPVSELQKLRGKAIPIPAQHIQGTMSMVSPTQTEYILDFDLNASTATTMGVSLTNTQGEVFKVGYDRNKKQVFCDRTKAGDSAFSATFANGIHVAPYLPLGNTLRLHLFFDASSVELFVDNGALAMTELFFPTEPFQGANLFAEGGVARLTGGTVYSLRSIW